MRTSIFSSETLGGTAGGRGKGSQLAFDGRQPKAERSGKSRERQAPRQAGCFRDERREGSGDEQQVGHHQREAAEDEGRGDRRGRVRPQQGPEPDLSKRSATSVCE